MITDTELPKATSTSALSGAGMLRLFNKVGETVNKITYRMDESDPVSCYMNYKISFKVLLVGVVEQCLSVNVIVVDSMSTRNNDVVITLRY